MLRYWRNLPIWKQNKAVELDLRYTPPVYINDQSKLNISQSSTNFQPPYIEVQPPLDVMPWSSYCPYGANLDCSSSSKIANSTFLVMSLMTSKSSYCLPSMQTSSCMIVYLLYREINTDGYANFNWLLHINHSRHHAYNGVILEISCFTSVCQTQTIRHADSFPKRKCWPGIPWSITLVLLEQISVAMSCRLWVTVWTNSTIPCTCSCIHMFG